MSAEKHQPHQSTRVHKKPASQPSSLYRFVIADPATEEWDSIKLFLKREWYWVLLVLVGLAALIVWVRPLPPSTITMAVGPKNSSMADLGKRFVGPFAEAGIELQLVYSEHGGREAAELAQRDEAVQAALIVGGLFKANELPGLQSLGSFQYAPLWIFHRREANTALPLFEALGDSKISIGPPDSSTHILMKQLAELDEIDIALDQRFQQMPTDVAVQDMLKGKLDAIALVDGYESANVQALSKSPDIKLFDFSLASAYQKHLPFMELVQIPKGSLNIPLIRPPADSTLLASTVSLLIDPELHPTVQQLFLTTADNMSDETNDFFTNPNFFPAHVDHRIDLSPIAKRYFAEGPLPLSSRLPYWLASLIDRLWLLVIGLIAILYPILKLIPKYRLIRSDILITDAYKYIRYVDAALADTEDLQLLRQYLEDLNWLESSLHQAWIASDMYRHYFGLRNTLFWVKESVIRKIESLEKDPDTTETQSQSSSPS